MGSQDDLKQLLGFISQNELRRRNIKKGRPIKDKKYETPDETRKRRTARKKWVAEHAPPPSKSSKKNDDGGNKFATKFAQGNPLIGKTAGFWEEVGQKFATGLDSTLDIISRSSYAANAFALKMGENDPDLSTQEKWEKPDNFEERTEQLFKGIAQNASRAFEGTLDDLSDPGLFVEAAKEAKKGFTGKKKVTFNEVVNQAHRQNPNNPFTQTKGQRAVLGFVGDVALDPLTYVGVGAVSKPLKKAAESAMDRELAADLAKLGVKDREGITLTADDYLGMMGEKKPNRPPAGLSRGQRRQWVKRHTVKGRDAFRSHRDTARRANRRLENYNQIISVLPKTADSAAENSEHIKKLKAMGDILDYQFREQVRKSGVDSLTAALKKIDDAKSAENISKAIAGVTPQLGTTPIGGEMSNMLDDVIQISNLTKAVSKHGHVTRSMKRAKRLEGLGKIDSDEYKKLSGSIAKDKDDFTKIVEGWTYGGGLKGSNEVRNILDTVDNLVKADPEFQKFVRRASVTRKDLRKTPKTRYNTKTKKHEANPTHTRLQSSLNEAYKDMDMTKSLYARELLQHKARGTNPFDSDLPEEVLNRVDDIKRQINELDPQIAQLEDKATTQVWDEASGQYKKLSPGEKAGLSPVDELKLKTLKQTQSSFNKELRETGSAGIGRELTDIDAKLKSIDEQIANTPVGPTVSTGDDVVNIADLRRGKKDLVYSRNKLMLQGLKEKMQQNVTEAPQEVIDLIDNGIDGETLFQKVKDGEITGPWADLFRENVENRLARRKGTLVHTALRKQRTMNQKGLDGTYDVRDLPENLIPMFSKTKNEKVAKLKITLDGEDIVKGGPKSREALSKHVTDADRAQAKKANKLAEEEHYDQLKNKYDIDVQVDELNPTTLNPKKGTKKAKGNKPPASSPASAVKVSPEYIAFNRLFTEQHGMSPEAAIHELRKAEGKYVLMSGRDEPITAARFVDFVRQFPDEVGPNGFGLDVPVPKDMDVALSNPKEFVRYADYTKEFGSPLPKDLRKEYGDLVRHWVNNTDDFAVRSKLVGPNGQGGVFHTKMLRQRKERIKLEEREGNLGAKNPVDEAQVLNDETLKALDKKALDDVFDDLGEQWAKEGNEKYQLTPGVTDRPIVLARNEKAKPDLEEIEENAFRYLDARFREAKAAGMFEVKDAPNPKDAQATLEVKLARMWEEKEQIKEQVAKATDEALETQRNVEKRLKEHMLISSINKADKVQSNALRITFLGNKIAPDINIDGLFKAVEVFSKAPVIDKAMDTWAKSFSPASKLAPELNKARLRAQSRTPELIKLHVQDLHRIFGKYKPRHRAASFKKLRDSINSGTTTADPLADKILAEFNNIVPYLDGTIMIGDEFLDVGKINKFLPDEFKLFAEKAGGDTRHIKIHSGNTIIKHMRGMSQGSDPMKAAWALRVAVEQAQADLAMKVTIKNTFGVAREIPTTKGATLSDKGKLVEQLHDGHDWVTVPRIGDKTYFDPETAHEINKLLDIMQPGKQHEMLKVYDKALRAWKSVVTVYNPGYYTRNGIGEVMMGMFDGVDGSAYTAASRIMSYRHPDPTKEALKHLNPYTAAKEAADSPKVGRGSVVKLQSGQKLSVAEVDLLYNQAGLKSGFVSTEFDHVFPVSGSLRATIPGRVGSKINDSVRSVGEQYEDYFRMAHFVSRLKRAPRGMSVEDAADWSANFVRKYHFDYTDFTPFEKSVMIRVFPFYKWTRKAMPLMASMLFTRPGMVNLYPKAMSNASYGTGALTPEEDENGFLPNYEQVTPDWVKGLFAYPMGEGDEAGAQNYMNIATPALDTFKMAREPLNTAVGMGSPLLKQPLEHFVLDRTMDPEFAGDLEGIGEHKTHALRSMPLTNLLDKVYEARQSRTDKKDYNDEESPIYEPGKSPFDERLTSFLTGLGIYENNETRKGQEVFFNPEKYSKKIRKKYGVD